MNPLRAASEIGHFLEERGIPYLIIGGLALQYWGEPRLTRDVDLTILVDPDQRLFPERAAPSKANSSKHHPLLPEAGGRTWGRQDAATQGRRTLPSPFAG